MGSHRRPKRPRREVSSATLRLLRPFFRRCWTRDAWILRVVGNRRGPVLVPKGRIPNVEDDLPERCEGLRRQQGRFARSRERAGDLGEDRQVGVEPEP